MPKILVVEDEGIVARSIKSRLELLGYEVPAVVTRGEEVLEVVQKVHPDLVLLDIRLQGKMDGVEVAQQLRAKYDCPLVYLTAYCDDETLDRAKHTQPEGFIVKPFSHADLKATIEMALYKQMMEKEKKLNTDAVMETIVQIKDAIILTDAQGLVLLMNPVAEALTGWSEADAKGKLLEEMLFFVDKENREQITTPIQNCVETRQIFSSLPDVILKTKRGVDKAVTIFLLLITDSQRNINAVACIIRDSFDKDVRSQDVKDLLKKIKVNLRIVKNEP